MSKRREVQRVSEADVKRISVGIGHSQNFCGVMRCTNYVMQSVQCCSRSGSTSLDLHPCAYSAGDEIVCGELVIGSQHGREISNIFANTRVEGSLSCLWAAPLRMASEISLAICRCRGTLEVLSRTIDGTKRFRRRFTKWPPQVALSILYHSASMVREGSTNI
jgi:hypothetical protein